jgi:hypothetical protein
MHAWASGLARKLRSAEGEAKLRGGGRGPRWHGHGLREACPALQGVRLRKEGGVLVPDAWACEEDPLYKPGRDLRVKRGKECGSMHRTILHAVALASPCLLASVLAAEAQPPDATLTVHTASIAVGVGYRWGGGIVTFQGQASPCRIDGLSIGAVGISSADAIGNVYHLTHIEDCSSHYTAVSAGALLAGGGDVVTLRHQHGVVIDLTATSQGAKMMHAVQGVNIALAGVPTVSTGQSESGRLPTPGHLRRGGTGHEAADPAYRLRTPEARGHGPRRLGPCGRRT